MQEQAVGESEMRERSQDMEEAADHGFAGTMGEDGMVKKDPETPDADVSQDVGLVSQGVGLVSQDVDLVDVSCDAGDEENIEVNAWEQLLREQDKISGEGQYGGCLDEPAPEGNHGKATTLSSTFSSSSSTFVENASEENEKDQVLLEEKKADEVDKQEPSSSRSFTRCWLQSVADALTMTNSNAMTNSSVRVEDSSGNGTLLDEDAGGLSSPIEAMDSTSSQDEEVTGNMSCRATTGTVTDGAAKHDDITGTIGTIGAEGSGVGGAGKSPVSSPTRADAVLRKKLGNDEAQDRGTVQLGTPEKEGATSTRSMPPTTSWDPSFAMDKLRSGYDGQRRVRGGRGRNRNRASIRSAWDYEVGVDLQQRWGKPPIVEKLVWRPKQTIDTASTLTRARTMEEEQGSAASASTGACGTSPTTGAIFTPGYRTRRSRSMTDGEKQYVGKKGKDEDSDGQEVGEASKIKNSTKWSTPQHKEKALRGLALKEEERRQGNSLPPLVMMRKRH
ncbi:unnamed protein product [Amoebophrya sp. A25]|nr:unnamed protein product [Amoebophrya sp. A25]|eukprot:GSA25T00002789001.1